MIIFEVLEVIACFAEMYILYMIYREAFRVYRYRESIMPDICLTVLGSCLIRSCNFLSVFSYYTLLVFVIYVSLSSLFLYKIRYSVLISIGSFYLLCLSCFDFLMLTVFSNLGGGMNTLMTLMNKKGVYRTILILSVKILWVLAFMLLRKKLKQFSEKIKKGHIGIVISCLGFAGFAFLVEQTFHFLDYETSGTWFLFFVSLVLLFLVCYFVIINKEEKMKLEITEMRNNLLEENYHNLNELYAKNAKLYHDINNHLEVLYQLAETDNMEGVKSYINKLHKPVSLLAKTIWTGDDVVDAVINNKIHRMNEKGIQWDVDIEFPSNTGIASNDICTILSNLLDNAIEATEKITGIKKVYISIRRINYFLLIKITNPCIATNSETLITTKENKILHGWGIPSVISSVEKYNGKFSYEVKGNEFVAKVLLCLKKE